MSSILNTPTWIAAAYAGMSLLTFVVYAMDKSAAKARRWRTPEATLHLLALAGGWPGALLAQQWLRHKSAKRAFRAVFWATVMLNVVGLWLLSWLWMHMDEAAQQKQPLAPAKYAHVATNCIASVIRKGTR